MKKIALLFSFLVILFTSCGDSPLSKAKQANEDLVEAAKNNDQNAYCRTLMDYTNAVCECETLDEFSTICKEVTQVDPAVPQFLSSLSYEDKETIDGLVKMCTARMEETAKNLSKDMYREIVEEAIRKDFE